MNRTKIGIMAFCFVLALSSSAFADGAICGDLNGDGVLTADDATILNRYASGLDAGLAASRCRNAGILQCGDVDKDGFIGHADWLQMQRAAAGLASPCTVEGFAASTNRLAGAPARNYYEVTETEDTTVSNVGSLRWALDQARTQGGGLVIFDLPAGNQTITVNSSLRVSPNTVLDGIGSSVTIDGSNVASNGTLNVWNSNTAVRHIRIRNAGNDGIQIAPKDTLSDHISNIAIQHVSVTHSIDGGIEVNGCVGLGVTGCEGGFGTTTNVTLADNFIAANGTISGGEVSGGGNLTKYGVTNVTMVGNFWEKNYRRNPLVDNRNGSNGQISAESLVDVRHSLVRSPQQHWVEVFGTNARVNVIDTCFEGTSSLGSTFMIRLGTGGVGGSVFVDGNSRPAGTTEVMGTPSTVPFGPVPCVSPRSSGAVYSRAGAAPRDDVDVCVIGSSNYQNALGCAP